jgi:hypothetical protein
VTDSAAWRWVRQGSLWLGIADRRGGDVLAVRERRIDRCTADHGRELLSALVADALELRDADVLNAWDAGPFARTRVVDWC